MRSAQLQVELRRGGNQLTVLGKATSLCKIVKCCVFCLFVKLRLSPGREAPGVTNLVYRESSLEKDIPGYRSSGKIRVASLRCTTVPFAPPGVGENTKSRFLRYFVRSVPVFRYLMLTPMYPMCQTHHT